MSEYQQYEWQTIDRMLTPEEQKAVNRLSSHISVSSSRADVNYSWGSFKHDPKEVLLNYFDAYFYIANWGSQQLMFRFPKGLLDEAEIQRYCDGEYIKFETFEAYQVLDIDLSSEEGFGWIEEKDHLSGLIPLRAELLQGDYRLLYLAWLRANCWDAGASRSKSYYDTDMEGYYDEEEDDEYAEESVEGDDSDYEQMIEPPVPPGLKKLSPALENFIEVFGIDPFVVQAAAEASPDFKRPYTIPYRDLVGKLSREECEEFLIQVAEGDTGATLALRKRLRAFLPKKEEGLVEGKRTVGQLMQREKELEEAEQKRQEEEARRKHVAEMEALAKREPMAWREVEGLLENGAKIASVYDEITSKLEKLRQLAQFEQREGTFFTRMRYFGSRYGSRPSLMRRWRERGWV